MDGVKLPTTRTVSILLPEKPSSWAEAEVTAAIAAGLVPANLQKNYTKPVSRGDVAQMFINLIEKSSGKSIDAFMIANGVAVNNNAFTDTTDKAALSANALGIISGIGNNKFDPNGILSRAQIAAIINRVARVMGVNTEGYAHTFTDVKGHWADAELGWPVHAKIISGIGDNKFDPNGNLTTEQAIVITNRALAPLSKNLVSETTLNITDAICTEIGEYSESLGYNFSFTHYSNEFDMAFLHPVLQFKISIFYTEGSDRCQYFRLWSSESGENEGFLYSVDEIKEYLRKNAE
jgi:hypothetical protein